MIQVANLNNLWTDPVAVLGAMCTVNLGKTLSPLEPRRGQIFACRPGHFQACPLLIL